MATQINFTYDGTEYTLEFNRDSVKTLEKKYDFSVNDLSRYQFSGIPDLFYCAFLMHHGNVKRSVTDEIWDSIAEKEELLGVLGEMYLGAINSLSGGDEVKGKAIPWKKVG